MLRLGPATRRLLGSPACSAITRQQGLPSNLSRHPLLSHAGAIRCSSSGGSKEEGASKKDDEKSSTSSSDEPPPLPLYQRFLADMGALFEAAKSKLSSAGDAASSAASAASTQAAGGDGAGAANPDAGDAVVVRPPSFWERHFNQESPFFERLRCAPPRPTAVAAHAHASAPCAHTHTTRIQTHARAHQPSRTCLAHFALGP